MNRSLLIATLSACLLCACLQSHCEAQEATPKSYPVLSGVGLALMEKDGHVYVTKLLPGSPAEKSKQIGEGDRLVAVEVNGDETSLEGKTYSEAASLIRGPVGTSLLLTIKRPDEDTTVKVPLTREPLAIDGASGANYDRFIGKPCPKLTLISLDSEETSDLENFKGKVVVLDFWASWCPTCYAPVAKLQKLVTDQPQWRDKVEFVTVSVDADRSNADAVIEKNQWNLTKNVAIDFGALNELGVNVVPLIIVIDPSGTIAAMSGAHAIDVEQEVAAILGKDK